jgi:hypothetical protein
MILTWPSAQALFDWSRAKSEFLRREQGTWGHLLEEAQRTAVVKPRLAEAQQRVASLSGKLADLHIRHEEAVADAKEVGEAIGLHRACLQGPRRGLEGEG